MAKISIYGATMAATVLSAMGYTVVSGCVRYTYTTVEGVTLFVEVAIGVAEALLLLGILVIAGILVVKIAENALENFKVDSIKYAKTLSDGSDGKDGDASKKLRRNLKDAGTRTPPYFNAAHHIVAATATAADMAREVLNSVGIDN